MAAKKERKGALEVRKLDEDPQAQKASVLPV